MKHISQWLKANKLTLNSEKTYYMVFHRGRRKSYNNIKLYIDDAIIKEASTIKYLGVILDNKLKWTSHIAFVAIAFSTIAITHLYIISIQIAIMSIVKPCLHITMK